MKKKYLSPAMDVDLFKVNNSVITTSLETDDTFIEGDPFADQTGERNF